MGCAYQALHSYISFFSRSKHINQLKTHLILNYTNKSRKIFLTTFVLYLCYQLLCGFFHLFFLGAMAHLLFHLYTKPMKNGSLLNSAFVSTCISVICRSVLQIFYLRFIKSSWFNRKEIADMINATAITSLQLKRKIQLNKLVFLKFYWWNFPWNGFWLI